MRALACLLALAACGESSTADEGGTTDAGPAASDVCPAAPPRAGASCAPVDEGSSFDVRPLARCVYGDDLRPQCRTQALCTASGWQVTQPDASCATTPALPSECPDPPTPGETCSDSSLSCWYPDGQRCRCDACVGGSPFPICAPLDPPEWFCNAPREGCPTTLPNAGDACTQEGLNCGTDCRLQILCTEGVWTWSEGACAMCASPETPIATPEGERPIASLRPGDLVYSVNAHGVVVVPIRAVRAQPVSKHHVLRLTLDDGRHFAMSGTHPTAMGKPLASLRVGDDLDGTHRVVAIERIPYAHDQTHDILPDTAGGLYFAAGALVGSTLSRRAQR